MPTYDYRCTQCGKKFSVTHTITEHADAKVTCPHCKSSKVDRTIGTVLAKTSKKS